MGAPLLPVVLAILGNVVYHLGQKTAGGGYLFRVLVIAYGAAFAVSLALWLLVPVEAAPAQRREIGAAVAIGLGAMAIEAGFYLAYRGGWPMGTTSLLVPFVASVVLAVVGVLAFRESLTLARVAGVLLASAGAYLVVRG